MMANEIERKFLVYEGTVPASKQCIRMIQAYLCTKPERTVRVRIAGEKAFLTIKGKNKGILRKEYEYSIPVEDARELMNIAETLPVKKVRKIIYDNGKKWEVDFFEGENQGLVTAEVELFSEDEEVIIPVWVGKEISEDLKYRNSMLSKTPYSQWK